MKRFIISFIFLMTTTSGILFSETIAILPFSGKDIPDNKKAEIFNDFVISFVNNKDKNVKVVERADIDKIISEHKLQIAGVTQEDDIKLIGKLTKADKIIVGQILKIGNKYKVFTKKINVVSGEIELFFSIEIDPQDNIEDRINSLVLSMQNKISKSNYTQSIDKIDNQSITNNQIIPIKKFIIIRNDGCLYETDGDLYLNGTPFAYYYREGLPDTGLTLDNIAYALPKENKFILNDGSTNKVIKNNLLSIYIKENENKYFLTNTKVLIFQKKLTSDKIAILIKKFDGKIFALKYITKPLQIYSYDTLQKRWEMPIEKINFDNIVLKTIDFDGKVNTNEIAYMIPICNLVRLKNGISINPKNENFFMDFKKINGWMTNTKNILFIGKEEYKTNMLIDYKKWEKEILYKNGGLFYSMIKNNFIHYDSMPFNIGDKVVNYPAALPNYGEIGYPFFHFQQTKDIMSVFNFVSLDWGDSIPGILIYLPLKDGYHDYGEAIHSYKNIGNYNIKILAKDKYGFNYNLSQPIYITNRYPIAVFTYRIDTNANKIFYVDAGISWDPDGDVLEYRWNFDFSGKKSPLNKWTQWSKCKTNSFSYKWKKNYTNIVMLEVKDKYGTISKLSMRIKIPGDKFEEELLMQDETNKPLLEAQKSDLSIFLGCAFIDCFGDFYEDPLGSDYYHERIILEKNSGIEILRGFGSKQSNINWDIIILMDYCEKFKNNSSIHVIASEYYNKILSLCNSALKKYSFDESLELEIDSKFANIASISMAWAYVAYGIENNDKECLQMIYKFFQFKDAIYKYKTINKYYTMISKYHLHILEQAFMK